MENNIKVINSKRLCHISFSNEHLSQYSGEIDFPGSPLHGKVVIKESSVRKLKKFGEYGKPKELFYLPDSEEQFKTFEELINHYNK